jgi:hypothetical protein
MSKTDKQLQHFVKSLLKYIEKDKDFNPGFTTEQIPKIFKGWTEAEFNAVHHGAGLGCCGYVGQGQYHINIIRCHELHNKIKDSSRSKWKLIIATAAIIFTAINGLFAYLNYIGNCNQSKNNSQHNIDNKTVGHVEPPKNKTR